MHQPRLAIQIICELKLQPLFIFKKQTYLLLLEGGKRQNPENQIKSAKAIFASDLTLLAKHTFVGEALITKL